MRSNINNFEGETTLKKIKYCDNSGYQNQVTSTILQRVATDDKAAVEECVNFYGGFVWNIARKFTKTKEDTEDAVQEIFIDIWKNAARFDPAKSPESAFIWLIARRRLIDQARKHKRLPQSSFSENTLDNLAGDSHKKLQNYAEVKTAEDAINKLKPQERQIVRMGIYEGMSHSEIASAVGLPLGTVKSRMRQGLHKIRVSFNLAQT